MNWRNWESGNWLGIPRPRHRLILPHLGALARAVVARARRGACTPRSAAPTRAFTLDGSVAALRPAPLEEDDRPGHHRQHRHARVGPRARPSLVSLAVARAARAGAPIADRAVPATASAPISARRCRRAARVHAEGRMLAPAVPGLYWLQWDMVEEGVTWFAQVAPRQPRTWSSSCRRGRDFFAPLPARWSRSPGCSRSAGSRAGGGSASAPAAFAASADLMLVRGGARRQAARARRTTRCSNRPRSRTG